MSDYHEPTNELSEKTRDYARALHTLQEEVEAIDWYRQRVDASHDESLVGIMQHNMHEEMEHACMTLEWLRRNMEGWDEKMKTYLFTDIPVTDIEEDTGDKKGQDSNGSLGLSDK
ncbi:MAG TPA: ferritin-like domain-containing protein [Bacteroidales bacterium]|nr:ferritin-like domain-containing protein [Bacteroidales bacterium]